MPESQKKTPCLEEFVAAGYPAERYEAHFAELRERGEDWSPTWSSAALVKPIDADLLPPMLEVRSQVRKIGSRITRRQQPVRHRFKQYLFSDPTKRLLRTRGVRVTAEELVRNYEELLVKESCGILAVHTLDGRRLDLASLKDGILRMAGKASENTAPQPPLDTIAADVPAGIPLSQFIDGTFDGDPAAERVLAEIAETKRQEGLRHGSIKEDAEDLAASVDAEDPLEDPAVSLDAEDPIESAALVESEGTEEAAEEVTASSPPPAPVPVVSSNRHNQPGKHGKRRR